MEISTAPPPWRKSLAKAVEKAGSKTALMRELNKRGHDINSHNVITHWEHNGIPAKYCPDIEAVTGVRCEDLCPDVNWSVLRAKGSAR